jgi:uncharacterized protein (TIGR02284 family)
MLRAMGTAEETRPIVTALNRLVETCTDAEKGYANAAANVRDPALKTLFLRRAQQRMDFVVELQRTIASLGATPENEGTLRGTLHRGATEARLALEGRSDRIVLEECARGERNAREVYEKALAAVGDEPHLRALVMHQLGFVNEALTDLERRVAALSSP